MKALPIHVTIDGPDTCVCTLPDMANTAGYGEGMKRFVVVWSACLRIDHQSH